MSDSDSYSLIVVGTGFAGSFFLHRYLERAPADARVLVLERGARRDQAWHIKNVSRLHGDADAAFTNRTPWKPWRFNLSFGGASNCWWACTPRMLPEDFELRSRFGVGADWPLGYEELEPYYCEAEELMAISGPEDAGALFPRSRPYPQPPHLFTDPEKWLKKAFPDRFFHMPSARPRQTTPSGRPMCCANNRCTACPIDSKYTILNSMAKRYEDARVTLLCDARADSIEVTHDVAQGVRFTAEGRPRTARAEFVALGANALFNPLLLLHSGIDDPAVGKGLGEQVSMCVEVYLDGVDNFQGSTSLTGHGYMLHGGERRARKAAALLETQNLPHLRSARGKWRRYLLMKFIFEDLRDERNQVSVDPDDPSKPLVVFRGYSDYAKRAMRDFESDVQSALSALPVESYKVDLEPGDSESHIMGSAVMGTDPATSVVDRHLVHHRIRNLAVLGSSAFPTFAPANPTLTLAALSLWSAEGIFGRAAA